MLISSPLLLDIMFLWNNDSIWEGIKNGEKHLATFLLPWVIIGSSFSFDFKRILKGFTWLFTGILMLGLLRYILLYPEEISKFLEGIEVWKMGYDFSLSLNLHAPALNMHIAFLLVANFYLLVENIRNRRANRTKAFQIVFFAFSVILLLVVNTRMAFLNALFGVFLIFIIQLLKKQSLKKLITQTAILFTIFSVLAIFFVKTFPYVITKYTEITFKHMDKIGRLDELENPEGEVYNALVTRVSIWKTAWGLISEHPIYGVGAADARKVLIKQYENTNQKFLYRHEFPTHNQYLDFFLKYGVLGFLVSGLFIVIAIRIGLSSNNPLALFLGVLYFTSNLTDDFLVRFDGIVFYSFWLSLFAVPYLSKNSDK